MATRETGRSQKRVGGLSGGNQRSTNQVIDRNVVQDVHGIDGDKEVKHSSSSQEKVNEIICCVCQQPIRGLIVQALNKTWHQDHFNCYHCKKPISGQKFNVHEGRPYCENDYAQLFLKRCHGCNLPIRDVVVVALDQSWHRDHFVCTTCGTKLANKGFFERENNPFCQHCYEQKFCPRCKDCGLPVTDTAIMALGEKWHQNCFKCRNCNKPVSDSTFEVINDNPICAKCVPLLTKT